MSQPPARWNPLGIPVALFAALLAFFGALTITSGHGPGLDPDSMAYIGASTSLAHHGTLRVPIGKWQRPDTSVALTTWPPAFPAAMAIAQVAGANPLLSGRLVIAFSAAATIALIVILLAGCTTPLVAVSGAALAAATPAFIGVHLSVLSEPLFLACVAVTLFGMARDDVRIAAAGATAAVLTRYAGVSAGAAIAIWFFAGHAPNIRARFRRAAAASIPPALAFVLWMAHNATVKTVQSRMEISYHAGIGATLREGFDTTLSWMAPSLSGGWAIGVAALAGSIVLLAIRSSSKRDSEHNASSPDAANRLIAAAAVLLAAYIAVIILARVFVGGAIRFDERILSPAFVLLEVMIVAAAGEPLRRAPRPAAASVAALAVLWMAASLARELPIVKDAIEDGNDFAASDWRESDTVDWVKSDAANRAVYTNWPPAIYFDAGRAAYDLPISMDADTLALFSSIITKRNGVLVAFDARNPDYPPTDSIAAAAHLKRLLRFSDGTIWVPDSQSVSVATTATTVNTRQASR